MLGHRTLKKENRLYDPIEKKVFSEEIFFNERHEIEKELTDGGQGTRLVYFNDKMLSSTEGNSNIDAENVGPCRELREPDKFGEWVYTCTDL